MRSFSTRIHISLEKLNHFFRFIKIEDLMPLTETGVNENDRLVKFGWYSGG